jgi:putative ABC transport system permease protein
MTILRLAIRNLRGAGLRTWLNAIALSFAFVAIIFGQGMLRGMNQQAEDASTAFEYGGGQYWQENYDPYDPLAVEDAHATLPPELESLAAAGKAAPILVIAGSVYPQNQSGVAQGHRPDTEGSCHAHGSTCGHDRGPAVAHWQSHRTRDRTPSW